MDLKAYRLDMHTRVDTYTVYMHYSYMYLCVCVYIYIYQLSWYARAAAVVLVCIYNGRYLYIFTHTHIHILCAVNAGQNNPTTLTDHTPAVLGTVPNINHNNVSAMEAQRFAPNVAPNVAFSYEEVRGRRRRTFDPLAVLWQD